MMPCPSQEIRKIWDEMKFVKHYRENNQSSNFDPKQDDRFDELCEKFEGVDILFGKENLLLKATIFWFDEMAKSNCDED